MWMYGKNHYNVVISLQFKKKVLSNKKLMLFNCGAGEGSTDWVTDIEEHRHHWDWFSTYGNTLSGQRDDAVPKGIIAKFEAWWLVTPGFRMSQAQIIFHVYGTEP